MTSVFLQHRLCDALLRQLEKHYYVATSQAGYYYLGFSHMPPAAQFLLPCVPKIYGKNIALYASGEVACNYYREITKRNFCTIEVWVSKSWEKQGKPMTLSPLSSLTTSTYDYVLIAVADNEMADEIRDELIQLGVAEEKLLWEKPLSVFDL